MVAFDAVGPSSAGATSTTSPYTWSHTCTGSQRLLIVFATVDNAAGSTTCTATYAGTAMTEITRWNSGGAAQSAGFIVAFKLINPATGPNNVQITFGGGTGRSSGGSLSFTSADQVTGVGTAVTADSAAASVSSGTIAVNPTTLGNIVVGGVTCGSGGISFTAGTSRFVNNSTGNGAAGSCGGATANSTGSSVSVSWNQTSDFYAAIAFEIRDSSTPQPGPPLLQIAGGKNWRRKHRRRQTVLPRQVIGASVQASAGIATVSAVATQTGPPFIAGIAGSGNGQYFVDQFGKPIFYLQDVPWGLPGNAGRWNGGDWQADISAYLSSRAAQGFTTCRVHIFGTTKTGCVDDTGSTWDGVAPFVSGNPANLNSTYWQRIDYLVDTALGKGITVEMTAIFDWDFRGTVFAASWSTTDATNFGNALGSRYGTRPNVLYFFGDDYFNDRDTIYNAVITGIRNSGDTHPATIEYYPDGTTSRRDLSGSPSGTTFGWGPTYAGYNLVYIYMQTYFGIEFAYQEPSGILVIWGDGYYYGDDSAPLTDRVERRMAWWSVSSGARGISTGSDAIWQWPSTAPAAVTTEDWYVNRAGAIKNYVMGLADWHKLAPDTGNVFVTAGRGTRATYTNVNYHGAADTYVSASITASGTLAIIYCASSMSITIDQTKMNAGYTATWVDPRSLATTGTATGSTYSSSGLGNNSAGDPDWVLVLQASAAASPTAGVAASSVIATAAQAAVTVNAGVATVSAVAPAAAHAATATSGVATALAAAPAGQAAATATAGVGIVGAVAVPPSSAGAQTYRLMDGVAGRPGNGPGSPAAYSGNFIAGVLWKVTADNLWFTGYWHWVPTGGDTTARKFALWQLTAGLSTSQVLVPEGTVTSGTLTANSWNFVALATPIALSKTVPYVACYGYVATNGFPDTQNQFGSGQTYAAGITNGPLFAYSDQGASAPEPFSSNYNQMVFSTAGSDPSVTFPSTADVHSNFWIDVQVTATPPAGAHYRIWPSQPYAINYVDDTADNFTLGCEFTLSKTQALNKIWFYSGAGYTQLPTRCAIWNVSGQTIVSGTDQTSPSWSGAAGSGWVSASYSGVNLAAGDYKVSVFNGAGSPAIWNPTTNSYFGTSGPGAAGISSGPITAPSSAAATSPGQDTYNLGGTFTYPLTFAGGADGANYWVDLEVSDPAGTASAGAAASTAVATTAQAAVTVNAGVAAVSAVAPTAGHAATASSGAGIVGAVATNATVNTSGSTNALAGVATVSALAPLASIAETVKAGVGIVGAVASAATVSTFAGTNAPAGVAAVQARAMAPALQLTVNAQPATVAAVATGLAPLFQVARSTSSVTARATSTPTVTDPRDGTSGVT